MNQDHPVSESATSAPQDVKQNSTIQAKRRQALIASLKSSSVRSEAVITPIFEEKQSLEKKLSEETPLQTALKVSYAKRVGLHSILFADHALPLQEVHFTVHESKEFEEKARLAQQIKEEKESKDAKDKSGGGEPSLMPKQQTLSIADLFLSTHQIASQSEFQSMSMTSADQKIIRRVLIMGDAGSGKTTLSKCMADRWRQNKLNRQYFFWLPARALLSAIQTNSEEWAPPSLALAMAIHQLCLEEPEQSTIGLKAIQRVLTEHPEQVLVWLDGYDEIAQAYSEAKAGSPIKMVMDAIFNTSCNLGVTSRGYSLPPNHVLFDCCLVNQGFNDEQIERYVKNYFKSLNQEKLAEQVFRLIRDSQLWQQAHTPLILTLICEIYRNAYENHQKLEDLSLLDLYDGVLKIFIRRYLDWKSKGLSNPKLAWEKTADQSLEELVANCFIEIHFLERLAFAGIEKGVQRLDGSLKQRVLNELQKDCQGKDCFIRALKLGFLYEFPSAQISSLEKSHEFVHLTLQEYLGSRLMVARLQRYEPAAYDWLRANKYQPGMREVLNFICMQMSPETYPEFWKVLLEEQSDITGVGHLQLVAHCLEASRCNKAIPHLHQHLEMIAKAVVECGIGKNWDRYTIWLLDVIKCVNVISHLPDKFWDEIIEKLKDKHIYCYRNLFLTHLASQAERITPEARSRLLKTLLLVAHLKPPARTRDMAVQALGLYASQTIQFSGDERSQVLQALLKIAKSENYSDVAFSALNFCSLKAIYYSVAERRQLLDTLLMLARDNFFKCNNKPLFSIESFCSQVKDFSQGERHQLLAVLLNYQEDTIWDNFSRVLDVFVSQIVLFKTEHDNLFSTLLVAKDKDLPVRKNAMILLKHLSSRMEYLEEKERRLLLNIGFKVLEEADSDLRKYGVEILGKCAIQAEYFSLEERKQLLALIFKETRNLDISILCAVILALGSYASQALQLGNDDCSQIMLYFREAVNHSNYEVRGAAVTAIVMCSSQLNQFDSSLRDSLLVVLQSALSDYSSLEVLCKPKLIKSFASQITFLDIKKFDRLFGYLLSSLWAHEVIIQKMIEFKPEEEKQLVSQLLETNTEKTSTNFNSPFILPLFATRIAKFSVSERGQIIGSLIKKLITISEKNKNTKGRVRSVKINIIKLLLSMERLSVEITSEQHGEILSTIIKMDYDSDSDHPMMNEVNWLHNDFLINVPYAISYNKFQIALEREEFLLRTPLNSLLQAYVKDTASLGAGLRPRNALWLKFIVERACRGGVTINVVDNQFILFGDQFRAPSVVAIPVKNRESLIKNFRAAFIERVALPKFGEQAIITLPIEIKPQVIVRVLDDDARLSEFKELYNENKVELNKINIRVSEHDKRLDQVESTLISLQIHVNQHDTALQAQQESMQVFKESLCTLGEELQRDAQATKTEIEKVSATIAEQEATVLKLAESVTTRFQLCEKEEAKREALYKKQDATLRDKQTQLDTALTKIQQEIEQLSTADASTAAGLKALEARQAELSQAYEQNQKRLAERDSLLNHPNLAKFYRVMHLKLSGFFLVCMVVSTGLVKAESQASLSEKIASKVIGVLGDNIPVPGAKAAASFINSMIAWHSNQQAEQGRVRVMEVAPISFSEKEIAIDLAIQEIIRRYGQHICVLAEQGVADLAECAVNRIAHGIQQEQKEEQPNFPLKMVQLLHQVKLKQGKLGHKDIATLPGVVANGQKPWNEDGIFRRTGIQSSVQYYCSDKVEYALLSADKPVCRYQKYGFRYVHEDEQAAIIAKEQGFELITDNIPSSGFQFKSLGVPTLTAPKGPLTLFGKTKQAATAVAKDKLQEVAQGIVGQVQSDPGAAGAVVKTVAVAVVDKMENVANSLVASF